MQLREVELACQLAIKEKRAQVARRRPEYSLEELREISQDGLISPSRTHITRIADALLDIRARVRLDLPPLPAEQLAKLKDENQRRIEVAWKTLDSDSQRYLSALGRMDKAGPGGYWTYLRYRVRPAHPYVNEAVG